VSINSLYFSPAHCFQNFLIYCLCICTLAWAKDTLVFDAKYDVAWKGWKCGCMHSQLWQKEDSSYFYTQSLKSSLFFLSFEQSEESQFSIIDGKIECKKYHVQRQGFDGPSYTVLFYPHNVEIFFTGNDDLTHYDLKGELVYDKLVTQLVLIRDILKNNAPGDRTVCFIDPDGVHHRTYKLDSDGRAFKFRSDYGTKSSAFTLDPKRRYIPIIFEQYRHGSLTLTGELINSSFGIGWDNFLA